MLSSLKLYQYEVNGFSSEGRFWMFSLFSVFGPFEKTGLLQYIAIVKMKLKTIILDHILFMITYA